VGLLHLSENDKNTESEGEIDIIKEFEYTTLVRINPKQSTLPIDTSAEWVKGYMLLNTILLELSKDTYVESYIDETGKRRRMTHVHPQMLSFLQERRRLQEQIWKISGGEAIVEGKKELFKKQADLIFQMSQDPKFKDKYRSKVEKIIEAEIFEE